MSELVRELRQAEHDLLLAKGALDRAAKHADAGGDSEALSFIAGIVHQAERRITAIRQRHS